MWPARYPVIRSMLAKTVIGGAPVRPRGQRLLDPQDEGLALDAHPAPDVGLVAVQFGDPPVTGDLDPGGVGEPGEHLLPAGQFGGGGFEVDARRGQQPVALDVGRGGGHWTPDYRNRSRAQTVFSTALWWTSQSRAAVDTTARPVPGSRTPSRMAASVCARCGAASVTSMRSPA